MEKEDMEKAVNRVRYGDEEGREKKEQKRA